VQLLLYPFKVSLLVFLIIDQSIVGGIEGDAFCSGEALEGGLELRVLRVKSISAN
jgi:hypothetical protein